MNKAYTQEQIREFNTDRANAAEQDLLLSGILALGKRLSALKHSRRLQVFLLSLTLVFGLVLTLCVVGGIEQNTVSPLCVLPLSGAIVAGYFLLTAPKR